MVAQILLVQPNCEGLLVSLAISGFSLKDPGVLFVLDLFVHFSWREKILDRFEPFVGQPKSRLKLAQHVRLSPFVRRRDLQNPAIACIGEQIERAVRRLAHVANALS